MTAQDLIAFEKSIAEAFNAGEIRAPVHLYDGCEAQMIDYFWQVKPSDWVCCSWRSHFQCLLHGVPPDELRAEILAGRSISLCFPKQRVVSSAIVGGILPIAVGIAMGIKRGGGSDIVHCFMGDMTSQTGMAFECISYANAHELPIQFIIEDNGKSVCTDTQQVFAGMPLSWFAQIPWFRPDFVTVIKYDLTWPHAGAGKRVQF